MCGVLGLAAVIPAIAWASGVRVVVIQPIGAIPKGVTAIVRTDAKINFIDSPDAMCQRKLGGVSLLCRGTMAATVVRHGDILARLPYSEWLFRLTGAPELDR